MTTYQTNPYQVVMYALRNVTHKSGVKIYNLTPYGVHVWPDKAVVVDGKVEAIFTGTHDQVINYLHCNIPLKGKIFDYGRDVEPKHFINDWGMRLNVYTKSGEVMTGSGGHYIGKWQGE